MDRSLQKKYQKLREFLLELEEVVIAYSGGVDSTLLLKVSKDELGDEAIALIGKSEAMPEKEFEDALFTARTLGVEPVIINTHETDQPDYCENPVNRCYICKRHIFGAFDAYMTNNELLHLIDGSNVDDLKDYRPGNKALEQYKVISPLKEAGFTKEDIRELSKELGLATWKKEAMACLSTRIAYNDPITIEKLRQIEKAEEFLRLMKFTKVRARMQESTLRIEVNPLEVPRFFEDDTRKLVLSRMKELGFKNVSVDMEGYKMGSMNAMV